MHILIADDHGVVRRGLKEILADTLPGTLSTVTTASGGKQITYNGYPLYTYKSSQPYTTTGNNVGGVWHVVMLSESDITG